MAEHKTRQILSHENLFKHRQLKSMGITIPIKIFSMLLPAEEVGPSEVTLKRHKGESSRATAALVTPSADRLCQATMSCSSFSSATLAMTVYSHLWLLPFSARIQYHKNRETLLALLANTPHSVEWTFSSDFHRKCHILAEFTEISFYIALVVPDNYGYKSLLCAVKLQTTCAECVHE